MLIVFLPAYYLEPKLTGSNFFRADKIRVPFISIVACDRYQLFFPSFICVAAAGMDSGQADGFESQQNDVYTGNGVYLLRSVGVPE